METLKPIMASCHIIISMMNLTCFYEVAWCSILILFSLVFCVTFSIFVTPYKKMSFCFLWNPPHVSMSSCFQLNQQHIIAMFVDRVMSYDPLKKTKTKKQTHNKQVQQSYNTILKRKKLRTYWPLI